MKQDVILLLLVGLFFSYLSYLFKVKKKTGLLSGVAVGKVQDVT